MPQSSSPPVAAIAVVLIVAAGGGVMLASRYSPTYAEQPSYLEPARRFLNAALAGDTVQLSRATTGPGLVSWALDAARDRPDRLRALLEGLEQGSVRETGGRSLVLFYAKAFRDCAGVPMALTFSGRPDSARIADASVMCEPR